MSRAAAALLAATLGLALAAAPAGAAIEEPVTVLAQAPAQVAAGSAFAVSATVEADAGALDVAAQPLRVQVRAEPVCAGAFAGGEGPVLLDQALSPPAAGAPYSAEVSGRSRLTQQGETTLCAYVDDAEERQFATDTEATLVVGPPCTVSKRRLGKLRRRVRGLTRRIHRAQRHHASKKRLRRLRQKRRAAQRQLRRARRQLALACPGGSGRALARSGSSAGRGAVASAGADAAPPQIKHLFVILLENENMETTFGNPPPAPFLATTMREEGAFIPNYYGIGHASLDNYLALVSGQPPNLATQADCLVYSEMLAVATTEEGIAVGQGCVFPASVRTVANQLENHGMSWHGYMQDMANSVAEGEPGTCRHPRLGGPDTTQTAGPTDQYAARHNPFVYFHSIIDYETCQRNVVDLSLLPQDLEREATTPAYSFITPDLCADGHDSSCADLSSPGGFDGINASSRAGCR